MAEAEPQPTPVEPRQQSTPELVRSIATDTGALVRKEVELAKHEITEALIARAKSALAFGFAGALGVLGLLFAALAVAAALSIVLPMWLAALVVMGTLFLMAGAAVGIGVLRAKRPPIAPTETVRTVKEDVEWARAQLKR
jgi:Putative Actinobacterial Holin-X, holin superfamily III